MFEPALGGRELEEQVHVGLARHSDGRRLRWFVFLVCISINFSRIILCLFRL